MTDPDACPSCDDTGRCPHCAGEGSTDSGTCATCLGIGYCPTCEDEGADSTGEATDA